MTETLCGYAHRDEMLVAYLYGDIGPADRAVFQEHLAVCARCRQELSALEGVRTDLAQWSPPEPDSVIASHESRVTSGQRWWRDVPAWAQAAAAVLFLGVAAGIANLEVRYDASGLTVRTGWSKRTPVAQTQSPPARDSGPAAAASPAGLARSAQAPWKSDLAALEKELRTEFHGSQIRTGAPRPAAADADLLARVRGIIDESEQRQQRELALRVADVLRDVDSKRRADLVNIDRSLGAIQNNTGVEVMRQRQLLDYLVRVSQNK